MNERYIWMLQPSGGTLKYPQLFHIAYRDFVMLRQSRTEGGKAWLDNPSHRNYERIVLIPQVREVDKQEGGQ